MSGQDSPVGSKQVAGKPLVSILIPAYNAQEFVADSIRSAIAQNWEAKEIVVVDDGSKDRTLEIAKQFEGPSVRVVTQKNSGAAAARNKAYSLSRGDFIQWLDADDLLSPDKIARQMAVFEKDGDRRKLLSSPWGNFMYRAHLTEFIPTELWADLSRVEWLTRKLGLNLYMQTATWLVSRELTEAAGPWDTRLLGDDDGEYFCRVLLASNGVRFVPEAKVYYRSFGFDGLSDIGKSTRKIEAQWLSMQLHIGYLRSLEDSETTRAACLQYLRNFLMCFYPERPDIVSQAEEMARQFGGTLGVPALTWKYSWIKTLFGWRAVKSSQRVVRKIRWSVVKRRDRALFRRESKKIASQPAAGADNHVNKVSPALN
jgi:glycosyltransferase involved in cell wall biosynthesis